MHNPRMRYRLSLAVALVVLSFQAGAATQGGPIPVPLPLFPQNNWWNTDISNAPLDPGSAGFISFIGPTRQMHPDFGGDNLDEPGAIYGIPFIQVTASQTKKLVDFSPGWPEESDGVGMPFYPIPDEAITQNGWVEGGFPGNLPHDEDFEDGDRHIIMVDTTNNHLYELFHVHHDGSQWSALSGAFFDMNTNGRRTEGFTSADAAGLAILPGLVRYDEVFGDGEIRHAFRVTVRATNGHEYPASHTAGSTDGALPMGARLRLKASKDITGYAPEIQKIFRAMKKYGLIVADNGSDMYVSGAYDTRWNNDILNPAFHSLKASDFEVVQLGWTPPVNFVLDVPAAVGAGDATTATLTAYDADYQVATSYTGTVQFTSTDGAATLPMNYTFTGGDTGTHEFMGGFTLRTPGHQVITMTDVSDATITGSVGVIVGPATPSGLVATGTSATAVALSWNPSTGAAEYELSRACTGAGYTTIATVASTSHDDTAAPSNAVCVYRVRAVDASDRVSAFSVPDEATTISFTDQPLTSGTTVKAVHVTQLRTAINLLRATAGLSAFSFADSIGSSVAAKALHVAELRTALDAARAALGLPALTYTDPSLTAGTSIKVAHVQQVRDGVR